MEEPTKKEIFREILNNNCQEIAFTSFLVIYILLLLLFGEIMLLISLIIVFILLLTILIIAIITKCEKVYREAKEKLIRKKRYQELVKTKDY